MLSNDPISMTICSSEVTLAEKLSCLATRGSDNTRAKDIWDIFILLPKADLKVLTSAIEDAFLAAGASRPPSFSKFMRQLDTTNLEKAWRKLILPKFAPKEFQVVFTQITYMFESLERNAEFLLDPKQKLQIEKHLALENEERSRRTKGGRGHTL